jgi:hypothetical protein
MLVVPDYSEHDPEGASNWSQNYQVLFVVGFLFVPLLLQVFETCDEFLELEVKELEACFKSAVSYAYWTFNPSYTEKDRKKSSFQRTLWDASPSDN